MGKFSLISLATLAFGSVCLEKFDFLLKNDLENLFKLFVNSGRDFDSLGDYEKCIENPISQYNLVSVGYEGLYGYIGLCLPKECTANDLKNLIAYTLQKLSLSEKIKSEDISIYIPKDYNEQAFSVSAIISLIFLSIIFSFSILGTLLDSNFFNFSHKSPLFSDILQEFSMPKNVKKLFFIPERSDNLACINGIKFLACSLIVFAHFFINQTVVGVSNPLEFKSMFTDFSHKFLLAYRSFLDIFFIISGFLLCLVTYAELEKKKLNYSWKNFILHRFFRLSPLYYSILIVAIFLQRYLGNGPQWPLHERKYFEACKNYWWTNFLFLQNFIPFDKYNCAIWTWYVAVDFQLFLVSPLLLLSHLKNKSLFYILFIAINLSCMIYIGVVSSIYNFTPSYINGYSNEFQMTLTITKPFVRISSFMMGMLIYFVYKRGLKRSQEQQVLSGSDNISDGSGPITIFEKFEDLCIKMMSIKLVRHFFLVLGCFLMFGSVLLIDGLDKNGEDSWNQNSKSLFLAVQKPMFCVGFAFLFLPLISGHFGALRGIFGMAIFYPLARITFALYLIHSIVFTSYIFSRSQRIYMNDFDFVFDGFALLVISCILAVIATICIEMPFLALEKKYFKH